jgi:nucleoside-diphosphate-sugar epimerase
MKDRFLITGGQGFIGAWIAKALIDEGVPVVIMDRAPDNAILSQVIDPERLSEAERVFCDIADGARVLAAMREHRITHAIHLAGLQVPACRSDPVKGATVNIIGTLNVFEAARQLADQVRGIAYASSAAVIGHPDDYEGPVPDSAHHLPRTHYGVFKTANEGNARIYWQDHGVPSVGLRPYTVFGVGREIGATSGPTKAMKAAVLGRRYAISFTGNSSFSYVEDLAGIFIAAARSDPGTALALNVRGEVASVEDFVRLLEEVVPEARGKISAAGAPVPVAYDLDETGLETLLGVGSVPRTPLREAIERTVAQFRRLAESGRLHDRDLGS